MVRCRKNCEHIAAIAVEYDAFSQTVAGDVANLGHGEKIGRKIRARKYFIPERLPPGQVNHCATSRGWAKVSRSLTKSDRRWRIERNHPELFASSLSSFSSSSQPQNAYKNPLPHNYFDLNNNSRRQWRISPHASEPVKNALEFLNPNHGIKKIQEKINSQAEKKEAKKERIFPIS